MFSRPNPKNAYAKIVQILQIERKKQRKIYFSKKIPLILFFSKEIFILAFANLPST